MIRSVAIAALAALGLSATAQTQAAGCTTYCAPQSQAYGEAGKVLGQQTVGAYTSSTSVTTTTVTTQPVITQTYLGQATSQTYTSQPQSTQSYNNYGATQYAPTTGYSTGTTYAQPAAVGCGAGCGSYPRTLSWGGHQVSHYVAPHDARNYANGRCGWGKLYVRAPDGGQLRDKVWLCLNPSDNYWYPTN